VVVFDDDKAVANGGLCLPMTLASPLAMGGDRTLTAVIVAEAAALALLRLAASTFRRPAPTPDAPNSSQKASSGPAAGARSTATDGPAPDPLVASARALAVMAAGARRRAPEVEGALHKGARRVGRAVGRASRPT